MDKLQTSLQHSNTSSLFNDRGSDSSIENEGKNDSQSLSRNDSITTNEDRLLKQPTVSNIRDLPTTAERLINTESKLDQALSQNFNDQAKQHEIGLVDRTIDEIQAYGQAIVDEASFGFNAVCDGVSDDYREGGVLGVIIGATGGQTEQGFFEQVNSDYASTSLIAGPVENLDRSLTSVAVGGAITKRYGGYTFGQLLLKGPAPHLGTYSASARLATMTTAVNSVVITGSYEAGNYAGSLLRSTVNRAARMLE